MATSRELQKRRDDKIDEVLTIVKEIALQLKEENESKDVQSTKKSTRVSSKKTT